MGLSRRDLLKAGAASTGLLLASPKAVFGATGPRAFPTSRSSRLFPGNGTFVVHSDLHNHSLLSDGATPAEEVFARMRRAELDVAALTDHALFGKVAKPCSNASCNYYMGIDEASWTRLAQLADRDDRPGSFVAMRGFEWTTGTMGHVNVWFSEEWIDSLTTLGITSPRGLRALLGAIPEPGPTLEPHLGPLFDQLPELATIDPFYEWLQTDPGAGPFGGGSDGLAGFNHPNEFGTFEDYKYVPELADRVVSCEVLNMDRDFLFRGVADGMPSPINACLNAGWRVGMLGVSDEHFDQWGKNRARGGLWVRELTRAGVREAMEARRMYATFEHGLRLDAAANGVQMGQRLPHRNGPVTLQLDIDRGSSWHGRTLGLQVLRPGEVLPTLAYEGDIRVPAPGEPVPLLSLDVDIEDGRWMIVRLTDPDQRADGGTPAPWNGFGRAIGYTSPWFLVPAAADAGAAPAGAAPPPEEVAGVTETATLPATGAGSLAAYAAGVAAAAALAARRLAAPSHDHPHDDHDHSHD